MSRSERAKRVLVLGFWLLALPFCGGKTAEPGSSESHFLTRCDASCAVGFECVCGICTQPCTDDASCHKLSTEAACLAPGATLGCADQVLPAKTCDAGCSSDQDCVPLGANLGCRAARCRPRLTCAERSARAELSIAAVVAASDLGCASDQDCVVVGNDSACSLSCGALVAATASATVQTAVDSVNAQVCGTFSDDGCSAPVPSCAPAASPVCVSGRCVDGDLSAFDATLPACAAALVEAGSSCGGSTCLVSDGCCQNFCDSSSSVSTHFCSDLAQHPSSCTASAPNATFVGVTPFGALSLSYAWSGFESGLSNTLSLLFTASSPAVTCETTRLGLRVLSPDGLPASYLGVRWLPVMLTQNGQLSIGVARLEIDSLGASQRSPLGTLSVTGAGWDLHVEFNAPECPDFSSVSI